MRKFGNDDELIEGLADGAFCLVPTFSGDVQHPEATQRFVSYLLTPRVIASISDEVAYANGNRDATSLVDEAITGDPGIYPPVEVRAKLATAGNPTGPEAAARKQVWDSIVYGSF